nr:hypothetical protein [Tanacetum cinerariifolium]
MFVIKQPISSDRAVGFTDQVFVIWNAIYDAHDEELKSIFEKQAGVERFDLIQTFHAYKQEEGKPVGPYVIKMKGYAEKLEHLSYTIGELHALLIEYEKGLPKKAATPQVMAIQSGRIQKANKKSLNAKAATTTRRGVLKEDLACLHCKVDKEEEASWHWQFFRLNINWLTSYQTLASIKIQLLGQKARNMNPIATQQIALDNSLVAPEKRLKIVKCNVRIEFSKPQREETYQVTLDALKLSPCYPAFVITAEICLKLSNQDFVEPPSEDELVSFIKELGYSGKCDMLYVIHTNQMHQPWRTFDVIINRCISRKCKGLDRLRESRAQILINLHTIHEDILLGTLKFVSKTEDYQKKFTPKKARKFKKIASPSKRLSHVLEEEPAKEPKQAKKHAKKSTIVPTVGVFIRDTPGVSASKKKSQAKVDRGKGIYLLSDVALLEAAQLKKAHKKSKQDTHILHSGLSDGVGSQPKVPDEQKEETTGDSDNDSNDNDSDEVSNDGEDDVDSDADRNNEASDSERTDSDEYKNLNLNPNDEYEELYKDVNVSLKDAEHEEEGKGDAKMTDAGHDDVSQEKSYEQVVDDAHVTLTATHVTQKTEGLMQSSSLSSDFASQFIILDHVPPIDNEVVSMMNVKVHHEEPNAQLSTRLKDSIQKAFRSYTTEFEKKAKVERKRYIDIVEKSVKDIIKDEVKSQLPHDLFKKPKRPPTPDSDWNARKYVDFRALLTWISKISQAKKPHLTFDEPMSNPIDFSKYVMNNLKIENLTQEHLVGLAFNLLKGIRRIRVELEYHFKECYKAFMLTTSYLKGGSSSMKDTTSTTKNKAAKYDDIQGIEDMVPSLWSPVKVAYDRYVVWGITHWGPKRQQIYGYASHNVSNHDVYSTKRIIAVTKVNVMKWYDYGYLEEIEVRREDQQLYIFKEGDFPNLHLQDIKDIRIVNLKRVEDLQLGVKSYQKKLNITRPETFRSDISKRTPYTAYNNPQGIIYLEKYKRNKLMRFVELYKFCDGTLTSDRTVLHDIASNLRMDYLPKRNGIT